ATAIRDKAISVVVFPEGGRSRDGHLGEFKDGASYIGIKSGTTVVPTALCGTAEVLPFGSGKIRPGAVKVTIGEPIDTSHMHIKERHLLTARIRAQIVQMLGDRV